MSQERLSMRKISEALRLKWAWGLSNRAIGRMKMRARNVRGYKT